jgi:hypothetical protein
MKTSKSIKHLYKLRKYDEAAALLTEEIDAVYGHPNPTTLFFRSQCYDAMGLMNKALEDAEKAFELACGQNRLGPPLKYFHRLAASQMNMGRVIEAKITLSKSELRAAHDTFGGENWNWIPKLTELALQVKKKRKKMVYDDPLSIVSPIKKESKASSPLSWSAMSRKDIDQQDGDNRSTAFTTVSAMTNSTIRSNERVKNRMSSQKFRSSVDPDRIIGISEDIESHQSSNNYLPIQKTVSSLSGDSGSHDELEKYLESNTDSRGPAVSPITVRPSTSMSSIASDDRTIQSIDTLISAASSHASKKTSYIFRSGWEKCLKNVDRKIPRRSQTEIDRMINQLNDKSSYISVAYPVYKEKRRDGGGIFLKNHDSINQLLKHVDVIADEDEEMRRCRALYSLVGSEN